MSEILAAYGFGAGLGGALGFVAGDRGLFSGKATAALFGSTIGGMIGYMISSRGSLLNAEFYRIFFGEDKCRPQIYMSNLEIPDSDVRIVYISNTRAPFSEEERDRWIGVAVIVFTSMCTLFCDWATMRIQADCKNHLAQACQLLSMSETSVTIMVVSNLFLGFIQQLQCFVTKKNSLIKKR